MQFIKMHGCGNDYIFIDCFQETVKEPAKLAGRLSDRHLGIGSDGLVLILPARKADFTMRMYNADGSVGEMCGNAIRCIGKYVYEHGRTKKTKLRIDTLAGIKELELHVEGGEVHQVTVSMGSPILTPKSVPVLAEKNIVIDEPITVSNRIFHMTCVSMGNPHAVVFVDEVHNLKLEEIGSNFEFHPRFPNRTNIEFVQIIDRTTIKMRVWERGSQETLACGTGACAAVVAGVLNNLLDEEVKVLLLGGELNIKYAQEEKQVYMTGPAVEVFTGNFLL